MEILALTGLPEVAEETDLPHLPADPDGSAMRIATGPRARFGFAPAVLIADSFGRPWRLGTVIVAIGVAGMPAIRDQRGETDRDGRVMQVIQPTIGDAVAAAIVRP